ncbi:MAG: AbrB/MazE/SpoVT family DNA-binding domain-containing protein [Bifidobacteriaceae bacterium]|nr:AbrB/MazE/SpoVT family DNA-binding domain-containing protein [Bifidobacteriaceae bacterium]
MVTIDKAGRVVIPKAIRDRYSLAAGSELEILAQRDGLKLTKRLQPTRALAWAEDGRPYFPAVTGLTTTDSDIQDLRDALQR